MVWCLKSLGRRKALTLSRAEIHHAALIKPSSCLQTFKCQYILLLQPQCLQKILESERIVASKDMIVRFHKSHLFNLPGCHSQVIGRSLTSVTVQSEPRSVIVEEMPPRMPPDLPFHFRLDVSWARWREGFVLVWRVEGVAKLRP